MRPMDNWDATSLEEYKEGQKKVANKKKSQSFQLLPTFKVRNYSYCPGSVIEFKKSINRYTSLIWCVAWIRYIIALLKHSNLNI